MKTDICLVSVAGNKELGHSPNVGLATLSAALKQEGFSSEVIHHNYRRPMNQIDTLVRSIKSKKPKVVGFSLFWNNYHASAAMAEVIKDFDDPPTVIFGGNLATAASDLILADTEAVDYIFTGYSEKTLVDFMKGKRNGRVIDGNFEDINQTPLGDRRYLWNQHKKEKHISIDVARSDCQGGCNFCLSSFMRKNYINGQNRYRSVDSVVGEIEYWKSRGVETFLLNSEDILANPSYFDNFINALGEVNHQLNLKLEMRAPSIVRHQDLVKKMFSHRHIYPIIEVGLQTFSDDMLSMMGNGSTSEINFQAMDFLMDHFGKKGERGSGASAYFLFPHPDMTPEQLMENINLFNEHGDYLDAVAKVFAVLAFGRFDAFPGTRLFDTLIKRGEQPDPKQGFTIDYKFTHKKVQKGWEEYQETWKEVNYK
ncbi:B12-binding domain-containing radical SAM protein [Nanoarchaeota archaeon]